MASPIQKISIEKENFPALLKEIPGSPKEIFYLGQLPDLGEKAVAIVGTRKASHDGRRLAGRISRDLAQAGLTIVSGLAMGIDAAAHTGALEARGRTIAVLGNGLDYIYPPQNHNLAQKILEAGGAIISEYPKGMPSFKHQFLERNRIVSGLSLAVVVIEAPIRSGALTTAKHALEQGREVFVVPGPAGHQNYEGSHMLLRQGARLVTNAKEVLEDLNLENLEVRPPKILEIEDKVQLAILNAIQEAGEPLHVDNIADLTKLEPKVVRQKLTSLMLENLVEEKNGKFKIRK